MYLNYNCRVIWQIIGGYDIILTHTYIFRENDVNSFRDAAVNKADTVNSEFQLQKGMNMESLELNRCSWANRSKEEMEYHDKEWGRPEFDDLRLFAMLNLEGQQAGLSWTTILRKRENFYKAYDNFDPAVIIHYDNRKIEELLQDPGIIRNRLKIKAVISNAAAYFAVINQYGSFHDFLWHYVDNTPIKNHWKSLSEVPASTPLSDAISKDMKKLGFKFVGTTIIYAYMQSIGMVNDHLCDCPLHEV